MKERPILFSGPMVCALLDGRKTQTRRVVKHIGLWTVDNLAAEDESNWPSYEDRDGDWHPMRCPYGVLGDRLWVRERWAVGQCADSFKPRELHPGTWTHDNGGLWYEVASTGPTHPISRRGRWRSSRFMPRWASRITLEITDVRVERVQDISGADALAEGVQIPVSAPGRPLLRMSSRVPFSAASPKHPREWGWEEYARFEFLHLFYDINKRAPVDANPWVWCLTFRRLEAGA